VAFVKGATEVVGKSIASNIATFAAAQAQVKGCGRCHEHKAASLPHVSAYAVRWFDPLRTTLAVLSTTDASLRF
jgi:cytochrome c553